MKNISEEIEATVQHNNQHCCQFQQLQIGVMGRNLVKKGHNSDDIFCISWLSSM